MALRKDIALALTGSQPPGWERILGGSASRGLTRGSSPSEYIPSLEAGNEVTQAFGLFLVPFGLELKTHYFETRSARNKYFYFWA
ncbi:hypothetical protein [Nostoc sp.]|uniref:hypothetical protein n=1 Tax=Nostoc sp. TaxID=1180 RepID=UPI002FF74F94